MPRSGGPHGTTSDFADFKKAAEDSLSTEPSSDPEEERDIVGCPCLGFGNVLGNDDDDDDDDGNMRTKPSLITENSSLNVCASKDFFVTTIIEPNAIELQNLFVSSPRPLVPRRSKAPGSKARSATAVAATTSKPKHRRDAVRHAPTRSEAPFQEEDAAAAATVLDGDRDGEGDDSATSTGRLRRVRFHAGEQLVKEYHKNGRSLSSREEWQRCWFTARELKSFRMEQAEVVTKLFGQPPANASIPAQAEDPPTTTSTPDQCVRSSLSSTTTSISPRRRPQLSLMIQNLLSSHAVAKWRPRLPFKRRVTRSTQKKHEEIEKGQDDEDFAFDAFDYDIEESLLSGQIVPPRPEPDWRESINALYQECCKVAAASKNDADAAAKGNSPASIDRSLFQKIYRDRGDLVGLEVYILFALRGSVSTQIRQMLDYYFVDRYTSLPYPVEEEEEDRDDEDPERPRQRDLGGGRRRQHKRANGKPPQLELSQKIRRMNLPCQIFVHEMALAQAAALHNDDDDNKSESSS